MKKFLVLSFILLFYAIFFISFPAKADGIIFNYVTLPLTTAKATALNNNVDIDYTENKLKKGVSFRTNYMRIVEVGDAGIYKAAKSGKISKIHYVEYKKEKIYLPTPFIPIYFDRFVTIVYGE